MPQILLWQTYDFSTDKKNDPDANDKYSARLYLL